MTVLAGAEGFTFGCDPEMFITDTNGEFVSAAGLIQIVNSLRKLRGADSKRSVSDKLPEKASRNRKR